MGNTLTQCAIYLRVSLDSTGEQLAISRQRDECVKIAEARGWVASEYIDNSISAYDRDKVRPDYDRMVRDYLDGKFTALICWDLDRLTRQPAQLEQWIDAAEARGLMLVTANGEADLSTDAGRLFARIKAAVARAESERKAARQRAALKQRANAGRPPLGVRLTGYQTNGEVIESEARIVREIFARFHAGDSLMGIAAWLTAENVPTRRGKGWHPHTVKSILTNPRYAGRAIYCGEVIDGKPVKWKPLVDEAIFDMVNVRLADPRRRKQVGTARKHLGSGLYVCGVCGGPVRSHGTPTRYRCPQACVNRTASNIDQAIMRLVRDRLARPDLGAMLTTPASIEAQEGAAQIKHLRARLEQTESDYDADLIDGERYKVKTAKINAELDRAEADQARLLAGSGVASTLTAPDPVAAFDASPLGAQRAVIDFLMTVRLDQAPRGPRGFDPQSIRIEWKHQ